MTEERFHGHGEPEPIGLEYMAGALDEAGFTVTFASNRQLVVSVRGGNRKLSFFSCLTNEFDEVVEEARWARRLGHVLVCGGYHACGALSEVIDGPFDHVVVGEGEMTAVALARVLLKGEELEFEGHHLAPGRVPHVLEAARIDTLDALHFPLRSEDRLGEYILYDLMWPSTSMQRNMAIVLTSRGCQHSCEFCASSTVWGQGVRFRSPGNIIAELRDLKERFGTNTMVIIDQSFGQTRQWTLDVCNAIRDARLGMNWYHQSNLTVERDVVKAMADAGCTKIGFGLEGISPSAAEKVKPVHPHDFEYVNDLFDYCTSLGLFVKAYLMLGFPWETEDIISEYFEWLPRLRASQVKISYMTPFPGTAYWERYSDQLISKDWADFDTVRMPVVRNPHISVERYGQIRRDLFRTFYGSEEYAKGVETMIGRFPHYSQSYREFCRYLSLHGMITGEEVWLDYVKNGERETSGLAVNQPS